MLRYEDDGRTVVVQAWRTLGLTDAQIVRFAEGVEVDASAVGSRG